LHGVGKGLSIKGVHNGLNIVDYFNYICFDVLQRGDQTVVKVVLTLVEGVATLLKVIVIT
jgi:hypothetical protein